VNIVDEDWYDSDYVDSEEGSEDDDGHDDHRGISTFTSFHYDDCGSSDEEEVAELHRERRERRMLMWLRSHFIHHLLAIGVEGDNSDDACVRRQRVIYLIFTFSFRYIVMFPILNIINTITLTICRNIVKGEVFPCD